MDRKKKKKDNPFAWPFAARRQLWINDADRLISEAADMIDPAVRPYNSIQSAKYRRAARLYEKSAVYYTRAGLGLMAQGSWQDAAEVYAILADEDQVRRCEGMAASIEPYWD